MKLDFTFKQSEWLDDLNNGGRDKLIDIQVSGGVCHAMSTEWVSAQLNNLKWNAESEYWSGVSHQRAFQMAYERDSERALRNFVKDRATRQGRVFSQDRFPSLDNLPVYIGTIKHGAGLIITIFGKYIKVVDNARIWEDWGHSVAMTRDKEGIYKFLDVNQGQFSWPAGTPSDIVGHEMVQNLHDNYSYVDVDNVRVFCVTQAH